SVGELSEGSSHLHIAFEPHGPRRFLAVGRCHDLLADLALDYYAVPIHVRPVRLELRMVLDIFLERGHHLVVDAILVGIKPVLVIRRTAYSEFGHPGNDSGNQVARKGEYGIGPQAYEPEITQWHFDCGVGLNAVASVHYATGVSVLGLRLVYLQ